MLVLTFLVLILLSPSLSNFNFWIQIAIAKKCLKIKESKLAINVTPLKKDSLGYK